MKKLASIFLVIVISVTAYFFASGPSKVVIDENSPKVLIELSQKSKEIKKEHQQILKKRKQGGVSETIQNAYTSISSKLGISIDTLTADHISGLSSLEELAASLDNPDDADILLTAINITNDFFTPEVISELIKKEILSNMAEEELTSLENSLSNSDFAPLLEKESKYSNDPEAQRWEAGMLKVMSDSPRIKLLAEFVSKQETKQLDQMAEGIFSFYRKLLSESLPGESAQQIISERFNQNRLDKLKLWYYQDRLGQISYSSRDYSFEQLKELKTILTKLHSPERKKFERLVNQALLKLLNRLNR